MYPYIVNKCVENIENFSKTFIKILQIRYFSAEVDKIILWKIKVNTMWKYVEKSGYKVKTVAEDSISAEK